MKLQDSPAGSTAGAGDPRTLLADLSASIPAAVCFLGRWSAIATTAARLRAALDDLFDLPGAAAHPLATALLRSLPSALAAALALCHLCAAPNPPKLHTQSDLAAAAASLHRLAADAELLLRSGALLAGTDSLRNLVTRLQIGTLDSRAAALDTLTPLLDSSELIPGLVPPLVRLLDSQCKAKAVAAIARISAADSSRHLLAAEGSVLLNYLARILECDDGSGAAEDACIALQALTVSRDSAVAIASRGGVATLLTICQTGTPGSRAAAAGVLNNLSAVQELRRNFLEDNAIPVLIGVISSSTALAQENVLACLCNLTAVVAENELEQEHAIKYLIVQNGGINCIKNCWLAGGEVNLEPAIGLLRNLGENKYIAESIVAAGLLPLAVSALVCAASSSRTQAARLIAEFALVGKSSKELGELECVPRLLGMLEAKAEEEQEAAVMALASLIVCAGNRRRFRREEKGVWNVVLLLDPLVRGVEKKYPVMVLQSVSQSRWCRKQMVAAGADGYLQRLIDMEAEGTKRLLERLGRGKDLGCYFSKLRKLQDLYVP